MSERDDDDDDIRKITTVVGMFVWKFGTAVAFLDVTRQENNILLFA